MIFGYTFLDQRLFCGRAARWPKTTPLGEIRLGLATNPRSRGPSGLRRSLCVRQRERLAVLLNFGGGLRRGELSGVKWEDIDFDEKQLTPKRSIVAQHVGELKTTAWGSRPHWTTC